MRYPDDIASILIEILGVAWLRVRNSGAPEVSALEADHVHNIPILLKFNSPDMLRTYLEYEKPSFACRCQETGRSARQFELLWEQLETAWQDHREFR